MNVRDFTQYNNVHLPLTPRKVDVALFFLWQKNKNKDPNDMW